MRDERDLACLPRLETHRGAGGDIEPHAARFFRSNFSAGLVSKKWYERLGHRLDLDEVQLEPRRDDLAALERQGVRIVADGDAKGSHAGHGKWAFFWGPI